MDQEKAFDNAVELAFEEGEIRLCLFYVRQAAGLPRSCSFVCSFFFFSSTAFLESGLVLVSAWLVGIVN